jgi:hypothetical protein
MNLFLDYLSLHNYLVPAGLAAGAPSVVLASAALLLEECDLNTRVGENSPSLCPIISSVTYTLIKSLPLCTANVNPIHFGEIVLLLAHVLIGL